ncbi:cbb3-type cytochrome oxidase assembly protein CcoS [Marinospirillum alkaliphilum]|uniref:Cytochrome oxidase maturation protein, cbb3-type n=1 Tax=Marinospirillum alkaliphilum DSM 21637 TaxID=1122209 RepID=A0A1K1VFU4_9GAMM|nr:cbb3-type cytochrome oxidase assembly protein CcoS [Marinospirillum alkaliphilum]SFX23927.1 cytochrome oxidase maturation protein, cbb3-type [Marinospirillum alkaliphilum DSM 21637]
MNILFLLIPLSLLLLALAIWAFFWAVKHDQFEDLDGPAYSILFDEDEKKPASAEKPDENHTKTTATDDAASKDRQQPPQ